MENEFLHYPRRRGQAEPFVLTQAESEAVIAPGPVRVQGFHYTNNDAAAATLNFSYADGSERYFEHKIAAAELSDYVPMPFYAEGGLSVALGGASEGVDVVVFMVGRTLTE